MKCSGVPLTPHSNVLLVEDDLNLAQFIRKGLKEEQYAVDFAADGEEVGLGLGAADVVQKPPVGVHAQAEVVHVFFHFVHLAFFDVVFG